MSTTYYLLFKKGDEKFYFDISGLFSIHSEIYDKLMHDLKEGMTYADVYQLFEHYMDEIYIEIEKLKNDIAMNYAHQFTLPTLDERAKAVEALEYNYEYLESLYSAISYLVMLSRIFGDFVDEHEWKFIKCSYE